MTLNYGVFVNAIVNFVIVAFSVFLLVKAINTARRAQAAAGSQVRLGVRLILRGALQAGTPGARCQRCSGPLTQTTIADGSTSTRSDLTFVRSPPSTS